jgi:4,5-dihydroxyphthalate decarboxylase
VRFMEIVGDDPLPIGVENNRKALEMIIQYAYDQKIIRSKPTVDELFAPVEE